MNSSTVSHPELGSRWHFLLAVVVAVVVAIGLTSTAAKAGLVPADARLDTAAIPQRNGDQAAIDAAASEELQATPASLVSAGTASNLALHPYLEEEQEFAPKFQHVVGRSRAGQGNVMARVGCALFGKRHCGQPIRT